MQIEKLLKEQKMTEAERDEYKAEIRRLEDEIDKLRGEIDCLKGGKGISTGSDSDFEAAVDKWKGIK